MQHERNQKYKAKRQEEVVEEEAEGKKESEMCHKMLYGMSSFKIAKWLYYDTREYKIFDANKKTKANPMYLVLGCKLF